MVGAPVDGALVDRHLQTTEGFQPQTTAKTTDRGVSGYFGKRITDNFDYKYS